MRKLRVILFKILLSFILTLNSNLFSVDDTQNTNVAQNQKSQEQLKQEETFWQKNKGPIIAVSVIATLIVASAIVRKLKKEKKKVDKNINVTGRESVAEKIINEPVPQNVRCEKDANGKSFLIDLDSGQKWSLEEWVKKYEQTNKYEEAMAICHKACDEWRNLKQAEILEAGAKRQKEIENAWKEEQERYKEQQRKDAEKFADKIIEIQNSNKEKSKPAEQNETSQTKESAKEEPVNISYRIDDEGEALVKDLNTGVEFTQSVWKDMQSKKKRHLEASEKLEQAKHNYLEDLRQSDPINISYRTTDDHVFFVKDLNTNIEFTYAAWLQIQSDKKRLEEAKKILDQAEKIYEKQQDKEFQEQLSRKRAAKEKEWAAVEQEINQETAAIISERNRRTSAELDKMSNLSSRFMENVAQQNVKMRQASTESAKKIGEDFDRKMDELNKKQDEDRKKSDVMLAKLYDAYNRGASEEELDKIRSELGLR